MGNEIAANPKPRSIATVIRDMAPEIQRALPKHMSGDRIARIALTEVRKNPDLADCTPESLLGSLLTASALGLEPGVNGESYLVPYKNKRSGRTDCQLIVGYQGVAKLFWNHPLAKRLDTAFVCENDVFRHSKGLSMTLEHQPATKDRGPVIGYYAIAELKGGALAFDYFTAEQIKQLRGGKVGTRDVADPEHWMERKTALKQVLKLMPKSVELAQAVQVDETVGSMAVARGISSGAGLPKVEHVQHESTAPEPADGWEQDSLDVEGSTS